MSKPDLGKPDAMDQSCIGLDTTISRDTPGFVAYLRFILALA